MKHHHTKNKGDLGVLKVQLELHVQGFSIFTSQSEHEPFDLIAYRDGHFIRIQVKYRSSSNGKIDISLSSTWSDKRSLHSVAYKTDEVDVFAIYCPDTDQCYFIPFNLLNECSTSFTIRIDPPKNKQESGIRMAVDYLMCPQLEEA